MISISYLELMGEIRVRGRAKNYNHARERRENTAVELGAFVAMVISGEAIRNVQIGFE